MASKPIPLVNGDRYQFASIVLDLGEGGIIEDITEISYSTTRERAKFWGTSRTPRGRTAGRWDFEGSITFAKEAYRELIDKLGDGYGDVTFPITVSYEALVNGAEVVTTDVLEGCQIDGDEDTHTEGTDALTVTVPLNYMNIKRDGYRPVAL